MTIQEHDEKCNQLFDKLGNLKAAGQGGETASAEYMETLKALQFATRARLETIRIVTL